MGPTQRNLACWNRSDLWFVNQSGGSSGPSQRISSRFLWAHQITAPPISRTRTVDSPLLHKSLCVWTIIPLHYVLWRRTFWGAENYVLFTRVSRGRWLGPVDDLTFLGQRTWRGLFRRWPVTVSGSRFWIFETFWVDPENSIIRMLKCFLL